MSYTYDVLVVGGGLAGTAAAIMAARGGRHVLLMERANCLGGAAANCLVNPFMPFWTLREGQDHIRGRQYLSAGFFREVLDRLEELQGYDSIDGHVFHEEILKLVLARLCQEAGVKLLLRAELHSVKVQDGRVVSVEAATIGGPLTLLATHFVDATGDGQLSWLAGASFQLGRPADQHCQPMTLCFRLNNIAVDDFHQVRSEINKTWKAWQQEGRLRNPREDVLVFSNRVPGVMHFNTTRVIRLNPTDPFDLTAAELEAREQVFEMIAFLREVSPAFRDCQLVMTASAIGVRESRKIAGEHCLTEAELKACTRFPDAIAAGNYDVDIHSPDGGGTSHYYFAPGDWYTIPYRSLVVRGFDNLLVTGRCISATHEAQASIRILPICCTLGEAAGMALTVAQDGQALRDIDVAKLQERLRANGAVIDEASLGAGGA